MQTKESVIEKLKEEFKEAQLGSDIFDWDAEYDSNILPSENETILRKKVRDLIGANLKTLVKEQKSSEGEVKEMQEKALEEFKSEHQEEQDEQKLYTEQNNFIIIGKKGSGKTALAWSLAKKISDLGNRKICVFNYPLPSILKKLPFKVKNVTKIEHTFNLTDSIVIIDESHEVFNVVDKKINNKLKTLLSKSRQNNTCFIFICHNSYFVNRSLFSFIDVKILKEVNDGHFELERKHIKRLYEDIVVFGKENFYIDSDYVRGHQRFEKPEWFSEDMSISYRSNMPRPDFFKSATKKCT
jgi:DNA replication protein DnaC